MSKIAVIGIVGNSVFLPVEHFHEGGETVEASDIHFELGGKGFNQAVAAKRCGADVSFLAAVGKDGGTDFADFLNREGIRHTLITKDKPGAFASIVTDKNGSNRVTVYQGADLSRDDVVCFEGEIASADILLLNNEVPEYVNIEAMRIAGLHGVKCILNPAPARRLDNFILENTFLFTPNEHETLGIENKNNVIVTLGKKGCLIKESGEIIPACTMGDVVDTTGAGDTFNGVLSAMIAEGKTITESATLANRIAALGVTRKYAVSSIPSADEIKTYIGG